MRISSGRKNQPITNEQKRLLVTNFQQTQSVSVAMRAAGIGARRTAYRWLHRYDAGGEAALQRRPHGSKRSNKTPDAISQQVVALAADHPDWGRRRLAEALAQSQPPTVMGASTVALVLTRAGFWPRPMVGDVSAPPDDEPTVIVDRRVDEERLADLLMRGLRASYLSASSVAATLLYERVWKAIWLGEWPGIRSCHRSHSSGICC